MDVYKLTHQRHVEYKLHTAEWITDNRLIGFFRDEKSALETAELLRTKPGFCDSPDDFTIDKYTVSGDGLTSVYLAEHSYYIIDERVDNIVEIGVYSTEKEAMSAVFEYEKTAKFPVGTHSWDDDFDIDNYASVACFELDEADFTDGFEQR
ncbi:MAG: hypothetical protein E7578_06790 [Ruminococcaceae bacterium]|nr:hypothetical protein [Oscillospiraceae bacterium]